MCCDELGLERVISQAGGLDGEQDWQKVLSLSDQLLLALASILLSEPRYVALDRVEMTLGSELLKKILHLLSDRSITCINIGKTEIARELYQAVLEYGEDGRWTWTTNPANHS